MSLFADPHETLKNPLKIEKNLSDLRFGPKNREFFSPRSRSFPDFFGPPPEPQKSKKLKKKKKSLLINNPGVASQRGTVTVGQISASSPSFFTLAPVSWFEIFVVHLKNNVLGFFPIV